MKRIKITSDGTLQASKVVDAETGEPVQGVHKVIWVLDSKIGVAVAILYMSDVQVELEGDAVSIPS